MNQSRLELQIARILVGPRFPAPEISREDLEILRDRKWEASSVFDRNEALNNARAILREMHVFPMSEATRKTRPNLVLVKKDEM